MPGVTTRALSFGQAAAAYERFRLGYPDALVDEVLAFAGRPVRTALEIGAGTGKATRVVADRGVAVTATDPDAAMLAELRRHVPAGTVTVRAAFEDLPLTDTYDLVYAAAALHWTTPEGRWERVAALLEPRGTFASFGGPVHRADPDLDEAVRAARSPFLGDDDIAPPDGTAPDSPMQWPGTELERSGLFTDVRQHTFERRPTLSAQDYVGHLSTISAYLELPAASRRAALERILEVLPERVTMMADLVLHLARAA
jgi:SAM-dependent methyltransferase